MESFSYLSDNYLPLIFRCLDNFSLIKMFLASPNRFGDLLRKNLKKIHLEDLKSILKSMEISDCQQIKALFHLIPNLTMRGDKKRVPFLRKNGNFLDNIKTLYVTVHQLNEEEGESMDSVMKSMVGQVSDLTLFGFSVHDTIYLEKAKNLKRVCILGSLKFDQETVETFITNNEQTLESLEVHHEVEFIDKNRIQKLANCKCLRKIIMSLPGFQDNLNGILDSLNNGTLKEAKYRNYRKEHTDVLGSFSKTDHWDGQIGPTVPMMSLTKLSISVGYYPTPQKLQIFNLPNLEIIKVDLKLNCDKIIQIISQFPRLKFFGLRRCVLNAKTVTKIEEHLSKSQHVLEIFCNHFEKIDKKLEFLTLEMPKNYTYLIEKHV